jgi:hypothetical protein
MNIDRVMKIRSIDPKEMKSLDPKAKDNKKSDKKEFERRNTNIMKKKESIGPKFTKIQQDGVKENVWTEECTANKVKNRYHQLNRSSKRPSGWAV